jgi:hypothetical protein
VTPTHPNRLRRSPIIAEPRATKTGVAFTSSTLDATVVSRTEAIQEAKWRASRPPDAAIQRT